MDIDDYELDHYFEKLTEQINNLISVGEFEKVEAILTEKKKLAVRMRELLKIEVLC